MPQGVPVAPGSDGQVSEGGVPEVSSPGHCSAGLWPPGNHSGPRRGGLIKSVSVGTLPMVNTVGVGGSSCDFPPQRGAVSVGSSGASSRARASRAELLAEPGRQDEELRGQSELIAALQVANAELAQRISLLEVRLDKNSQNSSKPPSADAFVKPPPRSLRRKSGRKPGKGQGQQGVPVGATSRS